MESLNSDTNPSLLKAVATTNVKATATTTTKSTAYKNTNLTTTYIFGSPNPSSGTVYSSTFSSNALSRWTPFTIDPFPNGLTLGLAGATNSPGSIVAVGNNSGVCLLYTIGPTPGSQWFTPTLTNNILPPFNGGQGNGVTFFASSGKNMLTFVACGYDSAGTHTIISSSLPNSNTTTGSLGASWTIPLNNPFANGFGTAAACNGVFWVAVGKGASSIVFCSYGTEITYWHPLTKVDPFLNGKACIVKWNVNGKYWLAGGEGPSTIAMCKTNPSGNNWVPIWTTINNPFIGGVVQGLAWNGVYWVAVGFNYDFTAYKTICIATSKDGLKWEINYTNPFYINGGVLSAVDWQAAAQIWIAVGTSNDSTATVLQSSSADPTGTWIVSPISVNPPNSSNPTNALSYGYGINCGITTIRQTVLRLENPELEDDFIEDVTTEEPKPTEEPEPKPTEEPKPTPDPIPFHTEPPIADDYTIIKNKYTLDFEFDDKITNLSEKFKPTAYFGVIESNDIAKFWITGLEYFKTQIHDCSGFKIDFGSGESVELIPENNYYTAVVDLKMVGDTIIGFSKQIQYSIRVTKLTILTDKHIPVFINKSHNEITLSSCLLSGTLVKTIGGWLPIQTLQVNDTVINQNGIPVKVVKILRMAEKYERRPKIKNKIMYKIDINCYGALKPVYISRHHKILSESGFIKAHEANLKLAHKSEFTNKAGMYFLYNLQLEDHTNNHLVINGGTIVESWDGKMETPVYIAKELSQSNTIRFLRPPPVI